MYIINQFITSGAFGVICKGYLKNDKSQQVAIKFPLSCTEFKSFHEIKPYLINLRLVSPEKLMINNAAYSDTVNFKREYNIMSALSNHKNILKIIDFKLHHLEMNESLNIKTIPMIITEFCQGGNLLTYLQSNHPLSEKECNYLFKQLISGLEYAHSLKIIHHDIKLENLLLKKITKNQPKSTYFLSRVASYFVAKTFSEPSNEDLNIFSYELKICDWGFARIGNENLNQYSGSPHYSAPEVYTKDKVTEAIDIWSTGVCLYAMSTGKLPFCSSDLLLLKKLIIEGKYNVDFLNTMVSQSLKNLLENILVVDPDKRFTILQIKNHPWYNSFSFED